MSENICKICQEGWGVSLVGMSEQLTDLQKQLSDLQKKYDRAVEVVKFYGDPETYIKRYTIGWEPINPENDNQQILGYRHPGTDWIGTINPGGKKAREFLKSIQTQ